MHWKYSITKANVSENLFPFTVMCGKWHVMHFTLITHKSLYIIECFSPHLMFSHSIVLSLLPKIGLWLDKQNALHCFNTSLD